MIFPTKRALLLCLAGLSLVPRSSGQEFDLVGALKTLSDSQGSELRIPPGRHLLPKGGVLLKKLKNVTLHAEGATWIATDLGAPALQIENCENLTIDGLTIDYDPLPFTQGEITAVDRAAKTADFRVHAGYPELSDAYLAERQLHLFEKEGHRWKRGAPDYYPKKIDRLTATTARVTFSSGEPAFDLVQVGDRVAMTIRKKSAVNVQSGCKGLRFENVVLHAAPGIGFLLRFPEEAGTFNKVRVIPGPRPSGAVEERLLSTSADAFNVAYARKGPEVLGCEFSFMGDDSINLHGVMLPVLKWVDDRTLLSMRPHKGEPFDRLIRAGDEIRFLKEPSYEITAVGEVESISLANENAADWAQQAKAIWPTFKESASAAFYQIRLKNPVSERSTGGFVEVPAINAPGFVIRDSYFHDHRARGLRLMASNGLVENNRIERLKGPAITIGGEFAFWREAGWCRDVIVRGNQITDVCEGANILRPDSYTTGAISIFARVMPEGGATRYYQGNENIELSGNLIDGCSVNGIQVAAARKVTVTNNTIRRVNLVNAPNAASEYGLQGQQAISVIQAEAEVKGNQVEEGKGKN